MRLENARRVMDAAKAKAAEIGTPVSIAIMDNAGCMVLFERADDAAPMTAFVAEGKAAGSALTGRASGALVPMMTDAPGVFSAISKRMEGQRFAPRQGAMPIIGPNGVEGAIGVSGATSEEDEMIAKAGAEAYGS
jgi:glc operon protein GlcG